MSKVLKADYGSADAYVRKALTLETPWFLRFRFAIPSITIDELFPAPAGHYTGSIATWDDWPTYSGGNGDALFIRGFSSGGDTCHFTDDITAVDSTAVFLADTWYTVDVSYNGSQATWKVCGSELSWSPVTAVYDAAQVFDFGGRGDQSQFSGSDLFHYLDYVQLGTTLGGSDIFADDFESGTFAAWDSTSGSVSIVDDPGFTDGCGGGDVGSFAEPLGVCFSFGTGSHDEPDWTRVDDLTQPPQ